MLLARRPVVVAIIAVVVGCARQEKPVPLTPAVFAPTARTEATPMEPLSSADQPGTLNRPARVQRPAPPPITHVSPLVQENVTTQPARSTTGPTTAGVSSGQYIGLGGVVAEVNGTPIYANKVIKRAEPALAARAKDLDEAQFKKFATKEISDAVQALVEEQLEYAAAERNLDEKDKELADMSTMRWRQEQITAAGGSEVVARQRVTARGESFDDLVQQEYRKVMSQIYYQKKVLPRVQVSADEIRSYYERNRDREFAERAAARFRLIKIEHAKHGGRDEALRYITELRNRIAKAGESFVAIAHSANDDPRLLKSGGDLGTAIQKGAFAIAPVDDAVWATDAGKVTEVIDAPGAFYIALVEEKTLGKVRAFDEATQTEIYTALRNQLFRKERMAERAKLVKDAVVRSNENMANIALEMAMQNYPRWRGGK